MFGYTLVKTKKLEFLCNKLAELSLKNRFNVKLNKMLNEENKKYREKYGEISDSANND